VRKIIPFCCVAVLAATATADTIVLKSGTRIVVDSVREQNGRVEYTIGDNTLTLPKSVVARVEAGPPASAAKGSTSREITAEELPDIHEQLAVEDSVIAKVIHGDQVDIAALHQVDKAGPPGQAAAAYAIVASLEQGKGDFKSAGEHLRRAIQLLPHHPVLLENYATLLLRMGKFEEALMYAEQATHAPPPSAEAYSVLGFAYYKNDRNHEAIAALKKSMQIGPSDRAKSLLDRIERESRTEAAFHEQSTNHFTLRYEGSQSADALRQQVLDVLESAYRDLQNELGAAPGTVFVSLYTDEAFFDVTQAPAWSAALNDGKIRLPISGVKSVTPELARILRHELTHSFISHITHNRAPQWLNEGVATIEQGVNVAPFGVRLAGLYSAGQQIPLGQLEGNFESYSSGEASVAYAESLAAVQFIRETYGMPAVAALLQKIGEGQSVETALRGTIHGGYADLEAQLTAYLKKTYGS